MKSLIQFAQGRHLVSRCARDVNEQSGEESGVFLECYTRLGTTVQLTMGLDNHRKNDDGNNHYWAV